MYGITSVTTKPGRHFEALGKAFSYRRIAKARAAIETAMRGVDFEEEFGVFLTADHQAIVRDFKNILFAELGRQLVGV